MSTQEAEPTTQQIEEDTPQARLVGEYFKLIDEYGVDHAEVKKFLEAHPNELALKEWADVAAKVSANAQAAEASVQGGERQKALAGFVGIALIAAVVAVGLSIGAYKSFQLVDVKTKLASQQDQTTEAQNDANRLREELVLAKAKAGESEALRQELDRVTAAVAKAQSGKGPRLALARVDDGQLRIPDKVLLMRTETRIEKRLIDGKMVDVHVPVTRSEYRLVERSYPPDAVRAFDLEGKPISFKELAKLLTRQGPVVISDDGQPLDPAYRSAYKADTIVLAFPAKDR
jgi:hypothetical protein